MIGRKLDFIFNEAVAIANRLSHEYLSLEVLLLALLKDDEVCAVLENSGLVTKSLSSDLNEILRDRDTYSVLSEEIIE